MDCRCLLVTFLSAMWLNDQQGEALRQGQQDIDYYSTALAHRYTGHARTYRHTHADTHTDVHARTYTHTCMHTHEHRQTHIHTRTRTGTGTHTPKCTCLLAPIQISLNQLNQFGTQLFRLSKYSIFSANLVEWCDITSSLRDMTGTHY